MAGVPTQNATLWRRLGGIALAGAGLAALGYLWQFDALLGGDHGQLYVVGCLLANAWAARHLGIRLHGRIVRLFDELQDAPKRLTQADPGPSGQAAQQAIFDSPLLLLAGPALGLFIAAMVAQIAPWPGDSARTIWLCALIFAANIPIGMALCALVRYWQFSSRVLETKQYSILNLSRPDLTTYMLINSTITYTAAIITCLALLTVVLLRLELGIVVAAFSLLSLTVVGATYAVPLFPLAMRLYEDRRAELNRIEVRILALTQSLDGANDAERAKELAALNAFRDTIRAVRTFPPNGEFSLTTAVSVSFLSFLPTLINYALHRFIPT